MDQKQPHECLSQRESQVLKIITAGKTVREIARDLSLSAKTIGTYRTRILKKMAMSSNSELVHYAHDHGLA
jgi:DNA-binding NarL/FixJ family response regulator